MGKPLSTKGFMGDIFIDVPGVNPYVSWGCDGGVTRLQTGVCIDWSGRASNDIDGPTGR